MKKTLLVIGIIILALGALAGAGFAGFKFGYMRGATASQGTFNTTFDYHHPMFGAGGMMPADGFHQNNRGFHQGFGPGGIPRMERGRGFDFFGPISFLIRIAVLGLILWLTYRFFKGNGWQLSLTRQPAATPSPEPESKPGNKTTSKK